MTSPTPDAKATDDYGYISTDHANDIFAFLERFGSHDMQYAVLLGTLIGFAKITNTSEEQVHADIDANWKNIPAPEVVKEH